MIFSSIESIADATGHERSRYQLNWDLSPCSIDPPQHHLFTGRSLLSGRRVGKWTVNHPGFVLRTDLCFEWLTDALIQGLKNWSEPTGNYGGILTMTLLVTHEGLKKPTTLDLILITSMEITELKFLTCGWLTIKKHGSR